MCSEEFIVDVGEFVILFGIDIGLNLVEYLLHVLVVCLIMMFVYVVVVCKVWLIEVEFMLEGDMDVCGVFGVFDELCNGFLCIRVSFCIKGDVLEVKLCEIVECV